MSAGRKNPDLCERPYCRERWAFTVRGGNERQHRRWELRACAEHAAPYRQAGLGFDSGGHNYLSSITPREGS